MSSGSQALTLDRKAASIGLKVKIAFAFGAIYVIWGSTFLATRYAVKSIPPFFVSGTRFFVAGCLLFAFARLRNQERLTWRAWRAAVAMGALFFLICHGGVSWAAQHVSSGVSALLMSSISMWTAILEWARPSAVKPGKRIMISLLVGFLGIALLVIRPEVLGGSTFGSAAAGVVLVGAFSWAAGTVLTRRMPLPSSTILSASMQMIGGGGLLLTLAVLTGQGSTVSVGAISTQAWLAMLYLTVIGSLVGFTCYIWLLGVASPTRVATYAYVNPIIALCLGWGLGGEQLSLRSLVASVIVVGSVATIITSRK